MATITEFQTAIDAAVTAYQAGDLSTALVQARSAQLLLIGNPDATDGAHDLKWDRQSIQNFIDDIKAELAGAATDSDGVNTGGIQRTAVVYVNPTS